MKPDDFEQRLREQPVTKIPDEWRLDILTTACQAQSSRQSSTDTCHSWLSDINHQLSTLLWPHPKAWAGLATVWLLIFAVNFSMRDTSPRMMGRTTPPSPEVMVELRQQQKLFAELIGPRDEHDADRSKTHAPRPRTQCMELVAV